MKKMKHSGKKVLSVFLAVLMVMTAWVFVAPTEAEAALAYGMSAVGDNFSKSTMNITNWGTISITYPSKMYIDKTESLNDAQYYLTITASNTNASLYLYPVCWGGQEFGASYNTAVGLKGQTSFVDAFNGYGISKWGPDSTTGGTEYGSGWFDNVTYDGQGCTIFRCDSPSSNLSGGTDKYYFHGTPQGTGTFSFKWSNYNTNNANPIVGSSNGENKNKVWLSGVNTSGTRIDMTIVVYDKSALNTEITTANGYSNSDGRFTTASWNAFQTALSNAKTILTKREVTQSEIDSARTTLYNARQTSTGLTYNDFTITWLKNDGTTAGTDTYKWGTTVNLAELAANNPNTLEQGNEQGHQTYTWGNLSTSHVVTDDVTISESPKAIVAHTYGSYTQNADNHQRTCSVCGYVQIQDHTRGTGYVTKEETCTEDGIMTYNCSVCGKKAIETSVINNITGHNFEGSAVENVTGENGNHWKKCSRCDAYGWSGVENACENHNWDKNSDGKVDAGDAETKASTCEEAGYEKYTCKVCNATWTKTLPLATHTIAATAAKDVTNVCGVDGNEAFWSCSVCNRVWKDEALTDELTDTTDADNDGIPDALETKGPDHVFTGAYVSASGGKDGTHHRQCARFTQCKTYGPEEKHTWGDPAVTDATCLNTGKKVYTCTSGCGQTYEETIEKAAHSMTKIEAVAPECGKAGNNEYYSCSICSKFYKDAAGTTETTVSAEKLSALEHKWTAHHDYDELKTAADCMNPAVYNNHCDYCKTKLVGSEHFYGTVDTVNGHKFDGEIQKNDNGTHSYKCTVAGCPEYGKETTCEFTVPVEDVASTCHTVGYTIHKCATCGKEKRVEKTGYDFTNHDGETEVRFALDAKCNTNGYTGDTYCLGCNTKIAIGTAIVADKTVHPHEDMKDYEAQASTCQVEGWKEYKYCSACGTYEIAKETIAKKAHKFTTYTPNGNGTHTAICDTCDATVATPVTDTKACSGGTANCVDKAVCTVCKTAYGEVNSSNHKTRTFVAKVDSTCQVEGTEAYYKCTACNTNIDTPVVIAKKDHSYGVWTKIAGEDKHTRSCTTCDAAVAEVATEIAPCSGGVANCLDKARCSTCKSEYGSTNPDVHKTEANTLKDVVAATCQAPGFSGNYRYNCCDAIKVAGTATAQLAHTYDIEVEGSRVDATCIETGKVTFKCSTCDEDVAEAATEERVLSIDAKKHASEETITVNAKAATCESDGHTGDVYYSCCYDSTKTEAENRKALKEKGTVIKANGQHVYGEAVPEYLIEAIKVKDDEGNVISKEFDLKDVDALTYDDKVAARRDDDKWYHAQICTICYEVTYDACYTYAHTSNCAETDTCEICEGLCSLKTPLVHKGTLTYVEKVPATCTKGGVKAHYACDECKGTFFDAAGKKPASANDLKISSAGGNHNYSSATQIEGKDKHEYSCNRCSAKIVEDCTGGTAYCNKLAECTVCKEEYGEIDETNHASTKTTLVGRVEATCSKNGYEGDKYYVCCYDETKSEAENEKALAEKGEVILSKPELHVIAYKDTDGDNHTAYCTACAYSVTVPHEWVEGETPELKNCTDTVEIKSTCVCGKTKTKTIVGEHDFEITVETKAATCSEAGYKKTFKACKKCNHSEELPEEILEKLPHNIVTEEAVKPTCDGVGKHAYTYCKNPGCPYGYKKDLFIGSLAGYEAYKNNDGKTVDKLGHQDKDNNGSCDNCYNPLKENIDGTRCNCICHKQNILMKIIYKILQFFWKLFKIEQTCGCGTKHW